MTQPIAPSRLTLRWPFAVVVLLLALMVAIPMWEGERRGELLDRTEEQVSPARGALLSLERAFAASEAEADAFLITGDTVFLRRLRGNLVRARLASSELEKATAALGPGVTNSVRRLRSRIEAWIDGTATELQRGGADATALPGGLEAAQPRLEEALVSAAQVDSALERVEDTTRSSIRDSEILEDVLVGALALAGLTISVLIGWLLHRLQQSEDRLRVTAAEREELLQSERKMREELEAAVQMRDGVLRIVSHDLRNPLHTIGIAVDLLELPLSPEVHAEQLGVIHRTVDRASRMLRDLLDASRLQAGKSLAIIPAPVEVEALLAEAVEGYRFQAEAKNVLLDFAATPEIPYLLADRDRVLQALSNLVGNALKFTPQGGHVRLFARPDGPGMLELQVSDSGSGISHDLLPRLFEPFSQAVDTATLGTGLGLSIVKGVVEAHGGVIRVESQPGQGATFRFTLPVADERKEG